MKTQLLTSVSLVVAIVLSGCANGADSADGAPSEIESTGAKAESRLLSSSDLGYGKLEFRSIKTQDGREVVYAVETSSAFISRTPIDDLVQYETPTNLELFLAVSKDQTPPQELVDSHAEEAAYRQRDDDKIRAFEFDRDAPVEKSVTSCNNSQYILPTTGGRDYYQKGVSTALNYQSGSVWMPLGKSTSDWGYYTGENVSLGVCNDSTTETAHMTFAWDIDNNGSDNWQYAEATTFIPPGGQAKQFNLNVSYWTGLQYHPAKYAINGYLPTQAKYHLRTIEFVYVPYLP